MPVPLPGPDTLVLTRPDADEVALLLSHIEKESKALVAQANKQP